MSDAKSYKRDQVVGIINSVLDKIKTPHEIQHDVLGRELSDLKDIIVSLKNQLHSSRGSNINIPGATDELDAVVGTTDQATVTIMESCEKILEIMKDQNPDLYQPIENLIIKIFEACTFQDVTGQRIKKVASCLKQIDEKVSSVLKILGEDSTEQTNDNSSGPKVVPLLNGPALPQHAVSQDDIDKLLAEFDN